MNNYICIKNKNWDRPQKNGRNAILTIGKVYDIRSYALDYYSVVSDAGRDIAVPYYYFKPIYEYRQEQINKVLE